MKTSKFLVTITSPFTDDEVHQLLSAALDSRFDDVDFEPATNELQSALERITHVVGHNSCSDGKTPNGFAVALDQARTALNHVGVKS